MKSGDWFAGGDGPTSADFMMSFALEAWLNGAPQLLGPKIKDYVKRIHDRYVRPVPSFHACRLIRSPQTSVSARTYPRYICDPPTAPDDFFLSGTGEGRRVQICQCFCVNETASGDYAHGMPTEWEPIRLPTFLSHAVVPCSDFYTVCYARCNGFSLENPD